MMTEKERKRLRDYRARTNNASTKKYEKTKKGFLMRLYRNMQSRICGVQKQKHHLYRGKEILPREEFYTWALDSKEFHKLFMVWEQSEYDRKLTPTVDRIDTTKGYVKENMQWLTHSGNSRRGGYFKVSKSVDKQ